MFNLFGSNVPEPRIINLEKPIFFVGMTLRTNTQKIGKDAKTLAKKMNMAKFREEIPHRRDPWAYVALSRNYNPTSGRLEYTLGDVVTHLGTNLPAGILGHEIPVGTYAIFTVKPGAFSWKRSITKLKEYIFTEWLPNSQYEHTGDFDEFELHDARSMSSRPEIDLYVPVKLR